MTRRMVGAAMAAALCVLPGRAAAQNTPEQVVSAYYGHLSRGETAQAAALVHPRALRSLVDFIKLAGRNGPGGAALKADSVPADSVFAVMLREVTREEDAQGMLTALRVETLGHLERDGLAYVVYTGRTRFRNRAVTQTELAVLRRDGAQWRIDPGDGIQVMLGNGGPAQFLVGATMQAAMDETLPLGTKQ